MEAVKPIDEVLPFITRAVADWKLKNNEELITKRVTEQLDKSSAEITMKLLGFNESWGKWDLDHCNGRGGESAAGDYLRKVQQAAIQKWLETVQLPEIPSKLKAATVAEYKSEYQNALRQALYRLAMKQAEEDAQFLIGKLVASDRLDNYFKAVKLINPQP